MTEHRLTTFIRTKLVFQRRLKDLKNYDNVKVYVYELQNLGCYSGPLLYRLREQGEIWYDNRGNFRVTCDGPINPELLERAKRVDRVSVPLTALHLWMREQLMFVTLPGVKQEDVPVYFMAFLNHRDKGLGSFFSVDSFSGRVHTPVVNLKGDLRFRIRFHGRRVVSLDVKQMQPTILARVLQQSVGKNAFSSAIFSGKDVYVMLQDCASLPTRSDAKKYLFQLIFGKPMGGIGKMFTGDTRWVDWINEYKSKSEPLNPHKGKPHTNLAWLLQYSEVQVMSCVWRRLMSQGIPFLTIHDELLCLEDRQQEVYTIMEEELKHHFDYFEITVGGK